MRSPEEQSAALSARIAAEIDRHDGFLPFAEFMRMALYEPGLGYYSVARQKFGPHGDFTTAAEQGDLLPRAIVAWARELFAGLPHPVILELGAGSGALARHLLEAWARHGRDDIEYRILEPSASLRRQQQAHLERFGDRIAWLEQLPAAPLAGLILANEVADALPVARFVRTEHDARPLGVTTAAGGFRWQVGAADPALTRAVDALEADLGAPLPPGYRSEISPMLPGWVAALGAALAQGAVLLIDYGLPRRELYHAERVDGTLICHYRHRVSFDPLERVGLQDISSWVDFSACAAAATAVGLDVAGFTTQAHFLLATVAQELPTALDRGSIALRQAAKTLLLPGEMGERFKLLLLTRGVAWSLPGRDLRSRL
ncbi:MAG TPA: SAM-dependent methyltransferase [Gammaproteobacteria bacterium]